MPTRRITMNTYNQNTLNRYIKAFMIIITCNMLLAGCGGGGGESDCDEVVAPDKDRYFGESCSSFTYGACPTIFSNCQEGECLGASPICTIRCQSDLNCGSGYYCRDNACIEPATCSTFCDGFMCCDYINDPNDPTTCIQTSCTIL